MDVTQPQSRGLLCILELPSVTTAGTGDILPTLVTLKVLSVKSIVDYIEWKTTGPWLSAVKPTPSLTLLERQLQMVLYALTLSSV